MPNCAPNLRNVSTDMSKRRINSRPIGFRGRIGKGLLWLRSSLHQSSSEAQYLVVTVSRATLELFGWPPQRTSPSLRRGLASNRLFASLDRCQALIIRPSSRICPLSIRSCLIFFVSGVKTNFQLAPKIASIRAIGQSSANKSFFVGHRGFPAIAEIAPRLRIVMPFSRVHFPIPSSRIRAPHTAVV